MRWVHCTCTAAQGWRFGAAKQLSKCNRTRDTGHGKSQGQEDDFHADLACRLSWVHADPAATPHSHPHPVSAAFSHLVPYLLPAPTSIGTRKSVVQNAATHAPETRFGARPRHALGAQHGVAIRYWPWFCLTRSPAVERVCVLDGAYGRVG